MMIEWRAGLRVSIATAHEAGVLSPDLNLHTIRVSQGRDSAGASEAALNAHGALLFGSVRQKEWIVELSRSPADRWMKEPARRERKDGTIAPGHKISSHTPLHVDTEYIARMKNLVVIDDGIGLPEGGKLPLRYLKSW